MSYRKKHIKGKIHRIKPKKSIFRMMWFWITVLVLIVIFSISYFLIFYQGIQVNNITISGNQKVATEELKNLVSNDIKIKILYFINSKSIFLINTGKINKEIMNKFPEVGKVDISRDFPQTLTLKITERKPIGAYCKSDNSCFSIDNSGIIFESLSGPSADTTILRQTINDSQAIVGQKIIAKNIIDTIFKIQKLLKDKFKIDLKEALIADSSRLDITTSENWKIYFDLNQNSDIEMQITKLSLLLNEGISADSRKNLRYINLSPKDRAVVCDNSTCGG